MTDPAVMRRAAELVGGGATRKEAAAAVGVSERTVRTWLKRPDLLLGRKLSDEDQSLLDEIKKEEGR